MFVYYQLLDKGFSPPSKCQIKIKTSSKIVFNLKFEFLAAKFFILMNKLCVYN